MDSKAKLVKQVAHLIVVVTFIQTDAGGPALRAGQFKLAVVKRFADQFEVIAVGAACNHRQRQAGAVREGASFRA